MALTDENGGMNTTMLVSPTGGVNGGLGNCFGGDGWWIILLFILLGNVGWGGLGGGFGAMGMMNGGLGYDFPWLMTGQQNINTNTNNGFRDAMINDSITSVRDGIAGLSTQICGSTGDIQASLCNGFAGVNATVNNGFSNAEIAANGRQMANMQQAFAAQTAMQQGFNQIGTRFDDCCCENRLGIADLKYTIATENCADRAALSDGIRDVITNQTANTQRILDQLCNDKIDAKNEKIADLERQLTMANLAASQTAQNAFIAQQFNNEVDALYTRLSNCPVPSTPVYGRTPIFTCNQNSCGCGCGA